MGYTISVSIVTKRVGQRKRLPENVEPPATERGKSKERVILLGQEGKYDLVRLSRTFKALGDENCIGLLELLARQSLSVTDLCEAAGLSQRSVSFIMGVLSDAGLVTSKKEGLFTVYSPRDARVGDLLENARKFARALKGQVVQRHRFKVVHGLCDFARLELLGQLQRKPQTIADLEVSMGEKAGVIDGGLRVLREGNLVTFEQEGAPGFPAVYKVRDQRVNELAQMVRVRASQAAIGGEQKPVLRALDESSRLSLLFRLLRGPDMMTALGEAVDLNPSTASRHLKLLLQGGLVTRHQEPRSKYVEYDLADEQVRTLLEGVEELGREVVLHPSQVFQALENENRLSMVVALLEAHPASIEDLAGVTGLEPATIGHYMYDLYDAGVVERRQLSYSAIYSPRNPLDLCSIVELAESLLPADTSDPDGWEKVARAVCGSPRLAIVEGLRDRPATIASLLEATGLDDSKLRRYLRDLRAGNLVVSARESDGGSAGRALYSLRDARVAALADVLASLAGGRLPAEAEALFHALADASRLALLDLLQSNPCGSTKAAEVLGLEQSNVAKHLEILLGADLVTRTERSRKNVDYNLAEPLIVPFLHLAKELSAPDGEASQEAPP